MTGFLAVPWLSKTGPALRSGANDVCTLLDVFHCLEITISRGRFDDSLLCVFGLLVAKLPWTMRDICH